VLRPGVVSGEQGMEFPDDLLGCGFRDQVALDLQLERLLEERGSLLAGHAQDGGIVGRAPVGFREPDPHELDRLPRRRKNGAVPADTPPQRKVSAYHFTPMKRGTAPRFSERSANRTRRHSSLQWKLQMACGEVDDITGLGCPGV
jgi:hypothetical protein